MKIFLLPPNENWICDRFCYEFISENKSITTTNPYEADIIWLLADWCWNKIPEQLLRTKKVVCSLYHIVPEKFSSAQQDEFRYRDQFVDLYHSMCKITDDVLKPYMSKPSFIQNFWVNQNIWKKIPNIDKKKYSIPDNKFIIGSFQRDTEGKDLISPKKEKGPDILADYIELASKQKEVHVILAGWRRQYIISRLKKANISYSYFEWADFAQLNELYNMLDLYVVSARNEGGPQAIAECAQIQVPIISTNVGIAQDILSAESIAKDFSADALMNCHQNIDHAYNQIQKYTIPQGFSKFKQEFAKLLGQ